MTTTIHPTRRSPLSLRRSHLYDLHRAGHRTQSTMAACSHHCAGGQPCACAAHRPHTWHICTNPTCPCHEAAQ